MMKKSRGTQNLGKYLKSHEYLLLIIFTFLTLVLYPYIESSANGAFRYHILLSLILLSGISSTGDSKQLIGLSVGLGISSLILNRAGYLTGEGNEFIVFYLIATFLFFLVVIIKVILSIVQHKHVNEHIIFGSIAGYLMIGMAGSFLFALIETLEPGSFVPAATMIGNIPSFLYYTFVSMLTIGYGDMIPVGSHAQVRSVILATSGQLYLTILIGIIIGKYVKEKM